MQTLYPELTVKRMLRFDTDGAIKAVCDVAVGELFLIRGLRIVDGRNGVFVSMPRQQAKNGRWFDLVSPLSKEIKATLEQTLIAAYERGSATPEPEG